MRRRFLPILFLASLLGCSKSDSNPIMDFGEGEGITYRDTRNYPIGPRDYSDWTSDGEWNKQERALFPNLSFDLNGPQRPTLISETTAYPNPAPGDQANWAIIARRATGGTLPIHNVQAVLVSRKYEVLQRLGPVTLVDELTYRFDYRALGLGTNELYRLYYVVYDATGLVYKGHGDVRYSPQ